MANVLISNLAMLKPFDIAFYTETIKLLEQAGHQCLFWSNNTHEQLSAYYLPLEWYFKQEEKTYEKPSEAEIDNAVALIEKNKWVQRIAHFNACDDVTAESCMRFHAGVSYRLLETFKPDLFIAFNPLAPHTGIPYEICKAKGIATITLERSQFLPQTLNLDAGGLMGKSEITYKTLAELIPNADIEHYRQIGKSQIAALNPENFLRNMAGVDASSELPNAEGKIKVAVLGIDDRAVGVYPRPHADNAVALPLFDSSIHAADSFAKAMPNAVVVYKSHPSLNAEYNALHMPSGKLHITNVAPDKLVQWADVVVSAGTSVETLALSFNKPVVLCGESPYKHKDICYQLNSSADIAHVVANALTGVGIANKKKNFEAFLGYCYTQYCIAPSSPDSNAYNVEKAVERLSKLIPNGIKQTNNAVTIEKVKRKLLLHPGIWAKIKQKLK